MVITLKNQKELDNLIKKEKEQVLNLKEVKHLFEIINKSISKHKIYKYLMFFAISTRYYYKV